MERDESFSQPKSLIGSFRTWGGAGLEKIVKAGGCRGKTVVQGGKRINPEGGVQPSHQEAPS